MIGPVDAKNAEDLEREVVQALDQSGVDYAPEVLGRLPNVEVIEGLAAPPSPD
jgi:hypothetical protein